MISRTLGRTGLSVPRVGLGLAALGRPGYINLGHAGDLQHDYDKFAMERRAHEVLDAAWSSGVRYFDAARSYGCAEAFLATWLRLRAIDPAAIVVASKWGYTYTADWRVEASTHEIKDHTLPVLHRQFAESHALLGAHLDLYQIHSATLDSGVLEDRGILDELSRLRAGGLYIGLSVSGPRQSEAIRRALDTGVFDCVQATWNLLEQSAGKALAEVHAAGIGVIVKESLANGRLTSRNEDPAFEGKRRALEETAGRLNCTHDALALAAVLAQPWADVVLSGAATIEQLESNLSALHVHWEANDLLTQMVEPAQEYWQRRSQLAWN